MLTFFPTGGRNMPTTLQLNKCETDPYFLQNFQCTTMFISAFCKICELNTEREIVFVLICPLAEQFHVHRSYQMHESTMSCIGNFEENIDLSHIHLAVFGKVHSKYKVFMMQKHKYPNKFQYPHKTPVIWYRL